MSKWRAFGVNSIGAGSIYPGQGETSGVRASAQTPNTGGSMAQTSAEKQELAPAVTAAASGGILGQPLSWFILIFVMLIGLMAIAHRVGDDKDFGNIRMSAYNVLTISIAAIIGIGFFKVLFSRIRVPGLSDYILAV